MKRLASIVGLMLLLSIVPAGSGDIWVEVFSGKVKVGETLTVGDYSVKLLLDQNYLPYIMVKENGTIRALQRAKFGTEVEVGSMKALLGNVDTSEAFIVLYWKPSLVREITPEAGKSESLDGYTINFLNVSEESVELEVRGVTSHRFTIENGSDVEFGPLALAYSGGLLKVYEAKVEVKREESRDYDVFYKFNVVSAREGTTVSIPVTVTNNANDKLTLPLEVVARPAGWGITFKDAQTGYEVSRITLLPKEQAVLKLDVEIPRGESGEKVVRFSVGDKTGEVKINVEKGDDLEISVGVLSVESEAGEKIIFPIGLTNYGDDKVITLSVLNKPAGWDVHFEYEGQRVRSFVLPMTPVGKTLTLVVVSPKNASLGEYPIEVAINNRTYEFSVFVYKTYAGEKAKLILQIADEDGNPVPRATVRIGDKVHTADTSGKVKLELDGGTYTVRVEKEGYEELTEEFTLEDGDSVEKTLTLQRKAYHFTVELESDHLYTGFGYQSLYGITIVNRGKNDDEYSLELRGIPPSWAVEFMKDVQGNIAVKSVKVPSGESKTVYLKVVPAYDANVGVYNATLVVKSSSGESFEEPIEVEIIGSYQISLDLSNYLVSVKAGESKSIPITVRNDGDAPLTNVKVEVQAPEGWEAQVMPEGVAKIERYDAERFTLTLTVPSTVPAGEYRITLKAKSDKAETQTELSVKVRQSSSSAYVGLLILVVAFGGLIFMMRRIGRR